MALSLTASGSMTKHQIGYACMTVLIILAFLFQALCFSFNNWYRMDIGPFMIRTGLWEMRIYDEKNITGLDALNHEKAEFRFYNPIWKSAVDRMDKMANTPLPKKTKSKGKPKSKSTNVPPTGIPRDDDPDIDSELTDMFNDPDYNQFEHLSFKSGENWFSLPTHVPDTVWDRMQGRIDAAEAFYSITWLATFTLMCLFAFHQFLPWFRVTLPLMKVFCGGLFIAGFFTIIAVICYGNAMPPICKHITNAYETSPNPKLVAAARMSSSCSFSLGYTLSVLSGMFLILTGIMAAVRIGQLQRGENFDLASAAGKAVSIGKTLLGGGVSTANTRAQETTNGENNFDWNQPVPDAAYQSGYDQGAYQAATSQGNWQQLQ